MEQQGTQDLSQVPPPRVVELFVVPERLREFVPYDTIPFYRPQLGHALSPDAKYAVRLNEAYQDAKAALEGERAYVRKAAFQAQELHFFRCQGKLPILIMGNFAAQALKAHDTGRCIEAALARCIVVKPVKSTHIDIQPSSETEMYRVCGATEHVAKLAAAAKPYMHFSSKPHHIEGYMIAHCFLREKDIRESMIGNLMFDKVQNIVTSKSFASQLTMRNNAATHEDLFAVSKAVQGADVGGRVHLRTHGTLRVTLQAEITVDFVNSLKAQFPGWKFFTDTPLNVWAQDRSTTNVAPTRTQDPEVQQALAAGEIVLKIAADHQPHPATTEALFAKIGAKLVKVIASKFSDTPMSFIVSLPESVDSRNAVDLLTSQPFSTDDNGLWYATAIKPRASSRV